MNKVGSPYIALYGPEARRSEIEKMFGCLPTIIGECKIHGYVLNFAHRRGGGIVPTMIPGDGYVEAMIYWVQYYEQRRLERRLGYPMGIQRSTFDSIVGDVHPCRVMTYYVPLIRERGTPDGKLVGEMEELYRENNWDLSALERAINDSADKTPIIRRVK